MGSILRLLAAALLFTLPAGAAAAAPATPTVEAHVGGLTLAPDGPEKITMMWLRATDATLSEHSFTMTVDFTDIAGFAEFNMGLVVSSEFNTIGSLAGSPAESPGPCQRTDTTFTCAWDETIYRPDTISAFGLLMAEPKDGAVAGAEGKVAITTRIDGGEATTTESTVRVGVAVDVAAAEDLEVSTVAGEAANTSPAVRNAGSADVNGVVMYVASDARLLLDTSYSNCRYGDGRMACVFDDVVPAGGGRVLDQPLRLRPPADSVPGSQAQVVVQWMTKTEWEDFAPGLPEDFLDVPGVDPPLTLTEAAGAQADPESDIEPENDTGTITLTVTGTDAPDFAAIGAQVTSDPSGSATIQVGARNVGPGTLYPDLYPNNQVHTQVVLPSNVEVRSADDRCEQNGETFVCYATETMEPGYGDTFDFALQVQAGPGRAGQAAVADTLTGQAGAEAADSANNLADIVVTRADGGGSGGGLPVTGSQAAGTAAVGLAMIAIGLIAVRRHRRPVCAHAVRGTGPGRHRKGTAR
ncbi:LPXTG cell wall anchor domain-containing protein [Paractinoplanes rishiriensis]|uniref:Uncharacterized protein n=1 Tax=Paractinoplanes rishiriensis TaxID=1050105 RepID=A0A919N191_9ACTN|nr:LPXTG cell wall anchor domain-containing protein [Actinoplanes rishiriensis]GIE96307.1 hypothetical protein Ari01nite_37720 [Actinoplanes rishiriensis]